MSVVNTVKHSDILDQQDDLIPKTTYLAKKPSAQDARNKIAEEMQLELEETRTELQDALKARDDAIAARVHEQKVDAFDMLSKLQRGYEDVRQKAEEANKRLEVVMQNLSLENSSLKSAGISSES